MRNPTRFSYLSALVGVLLILVTVLIILFFRTTITGQATFTLPEAIPGKPIQGSISIAPKEVGEVMPLNSLVAVSYGGVLKTLPLSRLLSKDYTSRYLQNGLIFTPSVEITIEFVPSSYYNQLPQGGGQFQGNVAPDPSEAGDSIPSGGVGGVGNTGGGPGKGGGIHGLVVSGSDQSFFQTVYLKYGSSANLASPKDYVPVLSSVKLRDSEISTKYATLVRSSDGLVVSTTYYETLTGIPMGAPATSLDLRAFNFIAKESGAVTVSVVYLGETLFSEFSDVDLKNVAPLDFDNHNRVLVNPKDLPTEVTVEGDLAPHTVAVGPVITPDLISVGCKSYVCDIASECSVPPLETLNKGVLVPVQKMTCRYTDCGISFQVTQSCDMPVSDVDAAPVEPQDIGQQSSAGSSVALIRQDTNAPVATVTTHIDSAKVDITFLQSPPILGDHCKDGVIDADEVQVDCGGTCRACVSTRPDYSLIVVWLIACLLGLLFFISLFRD